MTKSELSQQAIEKLSSFARLYGISYLFVTGGYCRALYLDRPNDFHDIDVACAYENHAILLGGLFASEILQTLPVVYHRSGTVMVEWQQEDVSVQIEFQGKSTCPYMNNQEIVDWMRHNEIEDVPLIHNLYGRDFTINALIFSLDDQKLYDPTHRSIPSFEKQRIESLLPPDILCRYNPFCILRAIRMSAMYDFTIDPDLARNMKKHSVLVPQTVSKERIVREIEKIVQTNNPKALDLLEKFGFQSVTESILETAS